MKSTTSGTFQRGRVIASLAGVGALTLGAILWTNIAGAATWAPVATPVVPAPGNVVPTIKQVTGKDLSEIFDVDETGAIDPQQVLAWDGSGGVRNSLDYSGTQPAPLDQKDDLVDGLASGSDSLFFNLRDDTSSLLFSVEGDPSILYVQPSALPGFGTWATAADINSMRQTGDTDGLEVWGDDDVDDSRRYSLTGDPAVPGVGRVAVWAFTPATGPSAPHTTVSALAVAMDLQYTGVGDGSYYSQLVEKMDVDAIMVFNDQVTFSIRPVSFEIVPPTGGPAMTVSFDGGEIWEYSGAGQPTKNLVQGGHTWDTALDIRGIFGVNSENIDAIEAISIVPEPASLVMLLFGLTIAAGAFRRR